MIKIRMKSQVPPQQDLSGLPLFGSVPRFAPPSDARAELGYPSRQPSRKGPPDEFLVGQPENQREATDWELAAFFAEMHERLA